RGRGAAGSSRRRQSDARHLPRASAGARGDRRGRRCHRPRPAPRPRRAVATGLRTADRLGPRGARRRVLLLRPLLRSRDARGDRELGRARRRGPNRRLCRRPVPPREERSRRSAVPGAMPLPRLIPCLDVAAGRVVKGVRFEGLRDVGDPVELGAAYSDAGADELVYLDVKATLEARPALVGLVARVAERLAIPFTVGGGVRSAGDGEALLRAGADKVAVNSAALERPELIGELAELLGTQAVVVAIDAARGEVRSRAGTAETGQIGSAA